MSVKDLKEFIFENYYKNIGFTKEDSYDSLKKQNNIYIYIYIYIYISVFAPKLIQKLVSSSKTKEYYESFLKLTIKIGNHKKYRKIK